MCAGQVSSLRFPGILDPNTTSALGERLKEVASPATRHLSACSIWLPPSHILHMPCDSGYAPPCIHSEAVSGLCTSCSFSNMLFQAPLVVLLFCRFNLMLLNKAFTPCCLFHKLPMKQPAPSLDTDKIQLELSCGGNACPCDPRQVALPFMIIPLASHADSGASTMVSQVKCSCDVSETAMQHVA